MKNIDVESKLLYKPDIESYILKDIPLHPAYEFLSCNHQSDYLRCYFMHHFGGGYADIKVYSKDNNWRESFDYLERHPEVDVVGQKEIPGGAAFKEYNRPENLCKLICTPYFIMRPHTDFTTEWWDTVNGILDSKYKELKANPAKYPRMKNEPGYPLRWLDVMGYPFHRLCYRHFDKGRIRTILVSGRTFEEYL